MYGQNRYDPYGRPTQAQPQAQPASRDSWEYYNGAWRSTAEIPAAQPAPKKRGRAGRVLGSAALVLACGVFGFGGAYGAMTLYGNFQTDPSVVYRAPEISTTDIGGTEQSSLSTAEVAALASQSVVSVNVEATVSGFGGRYVTQGAGSGVILTEDGYVITNNHVISGAGSVSVVLPDGSEHTAVVVGAAPANDIAVLKINVTGLVPAVLGDSDRLNVGEDVIAIGNSMGTLSNTVTDGIISALNRDITIDGYNMNLLQMSAAVSPGNSGGGLFNMKGDLIGVVNAKSSDSNAEGLGFAIPANTAMVIAQRLIEETSVSTRPGIGISVEDVLDDRQAAQLGHTAGAGVYITQVNAGGAGARGGLAVGDRILTAGGRTIGVSTDLTALLESMRVGDELVLEVRRGDETLPLTVTLDELLQVA